MADQYLTFKANDNCISNIYAVVGQRSYFGNDDKGAVRIQIFCNSSLSIKGFQLDLDIPWSEKIELSDTSSFAGTPGVLEGLRADDRWSVAIDSSPAGLDPHLITAFNSVIIVQNN